MKLEVSKEYGKDFIEYLIVFYKSRLLEMIDLDKLNKFEDAILSIYKIDINIFNILLNIEDILEIIEFENKFVLQFNAKLFIDKTNIKLITILKFINYGNANNQAYPIFSKTFNYIKDNLNIIYNWYYAHKGGTK